MFLICENNKLLHNDSFVDVYPLLWDCSIIYPGFWKWYNHVVVPDLIGYTRHMILYRHCGACVGIAITKNTYDEKKICTIKVLDKYQRMGIGKQLFTKCLETLNYSIPLISVAGERLGTLKPLLNYFGFRLENIVKSYYRQNSTEYVFNGALIPKIVANKNSQDENCQARHIINNSSRALFTNNSKIRSWNELSGKVSIY